MTCHGMSLQSCSLIQRGSSSLPAGRVDVPEGASERRRRLPNGKFKPLHMLNPCRLDYITSQIAAEFNRDLKTHLPFADLIIMLLTMKDILGLLTVQLLTVLSLITCNYI